MVQVLKENVKQKIYSAAVEEFYKKGYTNATIRSIAGKADIPSGLVYTYYKNKIDLLGAIVEPIFGMIKRTMNKEENSGFKHPFENFKKIELNLFLNLFDKRRELIILIDRSNGTKYDNAKETIIKMTEIHIKKSFKKRDVTIYNDFLVHILANSFIEGIFEVIRHCKNKKSAKEMMELVAKQYYYGIDGLMDSHDTGI